MKILKYIIVIIGALFFISSTFIVSAENITDSTGDVYYWTGTDNIWAWKQNINRDNIDITEISSTVNSDKIVISFKIVGTIQTTEKFGYYYYYNTSDTNYLVMVMGGNSVAMATKEGGGEGSYAQGTTVINGNTISAEFDILGDTVAQEIWGYSAEWTEVGPDAMNNEWWGDWVPNTKFIGSITDNDTDNDNNNGSNNNKPPEKTPGFELIVVIIAVGISLVLLKKRK